MATNAIVIKLLECPKCKTPFLTGKTNTGFFIIFCPGCMEIAGKVPSFQMSQFLKENIVEKYTMRLVKFEKNDS